MPALRHSFFIIFASQCIKALYTGIGLFFMPFPFPDNPECPENFCYY